MKRIAVSVSILFLTSNLFSADNGLWIEGKDRPNARVNTDLKTLSPDAFMKVAELADAAVVNINTTKILKPTRGRGPMFQRGPRRGPNQPQDPFGDFFGDDFFERFFGGPGGPQQDLRQQSLGSGFIINPDGHIVTNNHVIDKADEIKVTLGDESTYVAKVVGRDPKTDLALLKIDAKKKLTSLALGDSSRLKVGEVVVAIGNPFGLSHTVTQGIVSAKERTIGFGSYDDFIQTDASINPGNSGGPLLNLQGEVIGINAAIVASGQGIGFAIPVNLAKSILLKLKDTGKVTRGWLGVVIQKVSEEHAQALKLQSRSGALVSDVQRGSPAAKAGLKTGDVITRFNGREIRESSELPLEVANTDVGKTVKLDVIRDGRPVVVELKVGELKAEEDEMGEEAEAPAKADKLGLNVRDLTDQLAQTLGLERGTRGVLVTGVDPVSTAYERGIRQSDVILEVDRKKIASAKEYQAAIGMKKKGDTVLLLVKRAGNVTLYVAFTL
jgi:serine protease Do